MVYNDGGLYSFVPMLTYKCPRVGKQLSITDERNTSKTCGSGRGRSIVRTALADGPRREQRGQHLPAVHGLAWVTYLALGAVCCMRVQESSQCMFWRVDVVAVQFSKGGKLEEIRVYQHAVTADSQ